MWICLGCALAARQWERVWKRGAKWGGLGAAWQRNVGGPRLVRAELGAPDRPGNDDSGQKRARFWTELREGQREAEEHSSRLHRD